MALSIRKGNYNRFKFRVLRRRYSRIMDILLREEWRSDVQDRLRYKNIQNSPAWR